jgi:hypothetical protein
MHIHLATPHVVRRTASAIAATAVAFVMLGSSALAAAPVVRDHIVSSGAGAANNVCVGTICTSTSVFAIVNAPDGPNQACLDISRYEQVGPSFVQLGYETGCAPLAAASLAIDTRGLATASLSPTQIPVQTFTCDSTGCTPTSTRTALVSATYTGVGNVATFRSNSKSTFGACTMYFVGKGSSREAAATLTIDGRSLDAPGSLFTSTQKIKVLCH